jgi:serine protease Do
MRPNTSRFLRENFLGLSLTLVGVLCLVLAGMLYVGHRGYSDFALASGQGLDGNDIQALQNLNKAYERIAEAVTPAIVSIQSTQVMTAQQSPFFSDPFFRRFFGNMMPGFGAPQKQVEHALGSGVIVSASGYILTNRHVIRNATSIDVQLHDKRTFKAKVVGADPDTDLALLKINAGHLPVAELGDSSQLKVGDIVMAFGNPFNLSFTVTRGAVSALGRPGQAVEGPNSLVSFIQTDAAINPGNSGGALVNVKGQVIGINTAILSSESGPGGEGAFIGIGFAIPIDTAKTVMEDLIKTGKVSRGYLGVRISSLDPDLAKEFGVPDAKGALVQSVGPGGPADKAGVKYGDVIRKVNGRAVQDAEDLTTVVTSMNPGQTVTLDIIRNGKPMTIKLTLGERPANVSAEAGGGGEGGGPGEAPSAGALRGIRVQDLTADIRQQLNLPESVSGVVISGIDPNSPAGMSGALEPGAVIISINRNPVHNVGDFNRLAAEAKGRTLLRIIDRGQGEFVVINPGEEGQ